MNHIFILLIQMHEWQITGIVFIELPTGKILSAIFNKVIHKLDAIRSSEKKMGYIFDHIPVIFEDFS